MRKIYLPLFAALIALTGCNEEGQTQDAKEENDPLVSSGQQLMEQEDYDGAITAFKQSIENEPGLARPHLDLAVIYQQHRINYIHAIYHYDRYLELRPDTEKKDLINEQKLNVAKALANTLINNSKEVKQVIQERNQLVQERNQLVQQNNELKRQLDASIKAKKTVATPAPETKPTATQTIPKTAKPVVQTKPVAQTKPVEKPAPTSTMPNKHQIYHVVAGDTLTKISTKFYNDPSMWDIIYEANKDSMRSAGDLRVGQTIVIPAPEK